MDVGAEHMVEERARDAAGSLAGHEVRQAIRDVVDRIAVDSLETESDFYEMGLDSLDHAQILMRIEELYGLRVADEDFDDCRSIAAILAYARRAGGTV